MSRRLRKTLLAWKAELAEEALRTGAGRPGCEVTGVRRHGFWRAFRRLERAAGVQGFSPKSLRDTFASHLLTRGVPIAEISAMLGHSSVSITQRHYAQLLSFKHQRPFIAEPGQVPADILAEVGYENRHHFRPGDRNR